MKRVNRDGIRVTGAVPYGKKLSASEVSHLIEGGGVRILDTRMDRGAFDDGHISGAIYAPLYSPFFSTAAGSFLTEDDSILLVLEHEADLDVAARQLYRIGLDGLKGWILATEGVAAGIMHQRSERIEFPDFDPSVGKNSGQIIDVRTSAEYASGHLEGALSLPYTRIRQHLQRIPKDKVLYVHCASGKRAALATSYLSSLGYTAVHVDGMFSSCFKR
jgi:hydroxyacylglutathione hydrolase